ncbi:hypothetical protein BO79DRAFT_253713 [Aspergillus costaricaensis CBS 115574]|uniref:Uncharacterized protein n=1 Tax=Aspergillus costaricaensis CBS 115574 TaxID=1448317 RepID=A0ACD1IKJ4_9EURO|nr:hypothetical protein BO79DRAFT_253713 [Aspergillus costaricaensis CBS 115574]RAK90296.1 hypothetical protein BO79DRAFT_253713 [Aspergillus costaricaensis CBS 115574]
MFTGTAQALINGILEISGGPHTNVKFKTVSSLPMIPTSQLLSDSQSRPINTYTAASRSSSAKIVAMNQIQRILLMEWDGPPTRAATTVYRLQLASCLNNHPALTLYRAPKYIKQSGNKDIKAPAASLSLTYRKYNSQAKLGLCALEALHDLTKTRLGRVTGHDGPAPSSI